MIHYDDDCSSSDARDAAMFFLNRNSDKYTVEEFISLGQTERDKKYLSEALSTFAGLGILKVNKDKKIRLSGVLRSA